MSVLFCHFYDSGTIEREKKMTRRTIRTVTQITCGKLDILLCPLELKKIKLSSLFSLGFVLLTGRAGKKSLLPFRCCVGLWNLKTAN